MIRSIRRLSGRKKRKKNTGNSGSLEEITSDREAKVNDEDEWPVRTRQRNLSIRKNSVEAGSRLISTNTSLSTENQYEKSDNSIDIQNGTDKSATSICISNQTQKSKNDVTTMVCVKTGSVSTDTSVSKQNQIEQSVANIGSPNQSEESVFYEVTGHHNDKTNENKVITEKSCVVARTRSKSEHVSDKVRERTSKDNLKNHAGVVDRNRSKSVDIDIEIVSEKVMERTPNDNFKGKAGVVTCRTRNKSKDMDSETVFDNLAVTESIVVARNRSKSENVFEKVREKTSRDNFKNKAGRSKSADLDSESVFDNISDETYKAQSEDKGKSGLVGRNRNQSVDMDNEVFCEVVTERTTEVNIKDNTFLVAKNRNKGIDVDCENVYDKAKERSSTNKFERSERGKNKKTDKRTSMYRKNDVKDRTTRTDTGISPLDAIVKTTAEESFKGANVKDKSSDETNIRFSGDDIKEICEQNMNPLSKDIATDIPDISSDTSMLKPSNEASGKSSTKKKKGQKSKKKKKKAQKQKSTTAEDHHTQGGTFDQNHSSSPNSSIVHHHDLRETELDRSQDDSLVYKESPSKKLGTKLKSQRRGESFNLKNTGPAGTWTNSESTESVSTPTKRKFSFKKFSFGKRSASTEQKPKDAHDNSYHSYSVDDAHGLGSDDIIGGQTGQYRPQIMQSTPALNQYEGTAQNINSTPASINQQLSANSMPHTTSRQPLASQSTSSLDYSNNNSGDNTKENKHPPGYKSVFEYKLSQINKSYSTSSVRPAANSYEPSNRSWRSHNYENVALLEHDKQVNNSIKSPVSKPQTVFTSYFVNDMPPSSPAHNGEGPPVIPPKTYGQTLPYGKHPVWNSNENSGQLHLSDTSLNEGNTSGTDNHSTNGGSGNGSNKPSKLFYQPRSFNPHLEDVSSKDVKRHLEENRLKSPKDPPTRLPMVAKVGSMGDMNRTFQFDSEVTEANNSYLDRETQSFSSNDELAPNEIKHKIVEVREMATSPPPAVSPLGIPPVPDTSPPQLTPPKPLYKDTSVLNDVSLNVVNTPTAGYMYIVRQKPCYNTSTQTDTPPKHEGGSYNLKSPSEPSIRDVEVQAGNNTPVKARLLKEERGTQARPGSIVAANLAVNSKSVGVGEHESDYDNLDIWNEHGHKTITPSKTGAIDGKKEQSNNQVLSEKINSSRDVKPKSPKSSVVSSPQQYFIRDDDLAKIHDNSPNDTAMIRKLSQEYYSQIRGSNRLSGNFEDRKHNDIKEEQSNTADNKTHTKQTSDDKGYCSGIESKVSIATKNTLLEMRKDIESYERQETLKKTNVKPLDCNDNHKRDRKYFLSTMGQSNMLTKYNIDQQQRQLMNKDSNENMEIKQLSIDSGVSSNMDTHKIAEEARKDWIQSGKFHEYGGPKTLKRTVSEQIRPGRDQVSNNLARKGNKSVSSTADTESEQKSKNMDHKNNVRQAGNHAYQGSDPTQDYHHQNVRQQPENRLSSDSDSIFNSRGKDRNNRPNSNISTKSSSSGSTGAGDDRGRISDPDIKKFQQKALLNFYESKMKTKNRSSSSSMDSSFGSELPTPLRTSEISKKSKPQSLDINNRRHSTNSGPHSHRRKDIVSAELSPPALLDTSITSPSPHSIRGHSYSSSSATSTSASPRSDPQSPPLHPWPSEFPPKKIEEEDTDVNTRTPSKKNVKSKPEEKQQTKNSNDVTKSIQYSTSSTESSPPGISPNQDQRFAYQISSMNRSFMEDEEEHAPAPTLPPRNYRPNYTTRQVPQPMEPHHSARHSSSKSMDHTMMGRQSSSGQSSDSGGRSQPESGRNSISVQPASARLSSSSFTDVFTNDFDNTPARDVYADQLRKQSRKISKSQSSYLNVNAVKLTAQKSVSDLKTSIAVSRPVEKPSVGTSQPLLNSSVISKDNSGLSDSNQSSPTDHNSAKGISDRHYNGSRHSIGSTHSHDLPVIRSNDGGRFSISSAGELNSHRGIYHSPQGSSSSDKGVYLSPMTTNNHLMEDIGSHQQTNLNRSEQSDLQRELDELPPPPPPPHQPYHHSPSASLLGDKPLPPPPPDQEPYKEQNERFSSDSYISNKSNYRKAFAGNYSPVSSHSPQTPSKQLSINPPKHDTMVHVTKSITVNSTEHTSVESPPWNKPYSPIHPYSNNNSRLSPISMDTPNSSSSRLEGNRCGALENNTEQEVTDSPSVKSYVANIEGRDRHKQWNDRGTPVTRSKVSELKQTLLRNSNENLSEISSSEGKRSRSSSQENILLNNSVSSEELRGSSPQLQHNNLPSSTEDISSKYSNNNNSRTDMSDIQDCCHSREKSDPQSDGDTRSNDSGVAEDISHIRQKSQEEIDCEKQALLVASHLKEQDKHLSEVILPRPQYKSSTDYVSGLFDTKVNVMHKPSIRVSTLSRTRPEPLKNKSLSNTEETPTKSDNNSALPPQHSPYWSPPPLADLHNRMRQENVDELLKDMQSSIEQEKSELIGRIEKKIEILKEEKTILEEEIQENEALGRELAVIVEQKIESKAELNKYKLYVSELDKVTILLLKLSGRLARAENGIMSLKEDASEKEKSILITKRDELQEKLEDAKLLKEGIDRRSNQVAKFLQKHLTSEEYEDYGHFIKMKSKLTIDQQEIEDKLKLGDEQMAALRKSMNQSDC